MSSKKLVYQVNPDTDSVTGSDDKVREVLRKALEEAWTLIKIKFRWDTSHNRYICNHHTKYGRLPMIIKWLVVE